MGHAHTETRPSNHFEGMRSTLFDDLNVVYFIVPLGVGSFASETSEPVGAVHGPSNERHRVSSLINIICVFVLGLLAR